MNLEGFKSTSELVTYLKQVTGDLIISSMSMDHIKGCIDQKFDLYLQTAESDSCVIKYANYAGIQPDGCMVYTTKVRIGASVSCFFHTMLSSLFHWQTWYRDVVVLSN